jgi:uncharacterized protein
MRRRLLIAGGVAIAALSFGCSRPAAVDRHNPIESPVPEANAGRLWAQYEVAVRVANGDGVKDPPDYADAAKWCRLAAGRGHAGAQAMLGVMHHRGHGVPRDDTEAYKWLMLAIRQQPAERDAYVLWREEVAHGLTAQQIADASALADSWRASP